MVRLNASLCGGIIQEAIREEFGTCGRREYDPTEFTVDVITMESAIQNGIASPRYDLNSEYNTATVLMIPKTPCTPNLSAPMRKNTTLFLLVVGLVPWSSTGNFLQGSPCASEQ